MSYSQIYTLFNEYLDSIYHAGYAEQLAIEDYISYIFQFEQFKEMFI